MLTHPTTDRLRELGLVGMARALEEQRRHPDVADLGFADLGADYPDRLNKHRTAKRSDPSLQPEPSMEHCQHPGPVRPIVILGQPVFGC